MKILFLINSLEGGGAERVVSTLAFHLQTAGHDLSILTLHDARPAYALPPDVQVRHLGGVALAVGPGKLLSLPIQAWRLRRELRRVAPDVALSFLSRANLVHVLSAIGGSTAPVVISERMQATEHYRGTFANFVMRRLVGVVYPRADAVIAISHGVKKSLIGIGVPAEKIRVIHNPIDITGIEPRAGRSAALERGSVHLITLGRFVAFKDQKTIIHALGAVRTRGYDARLTLIGDGRLRQDLEDEIRALGLEQYVTITGWLADPHALLPGADIFMFSSRYEAFGNVITEAMACGLPVVSSECPGGPIEILEGGRYGLLFPVGDHEAMADRVVQLIDDAALYERLQKTGLERATHFAVEVIGEQYVAALREAVEGHA